jgi:hypothetical protein
LADYSHHTVIVGIAALVEQSIQELINIGQLDAQEHATESAFTQSMVAQLSRQYPDKNVIIYHDQDSQFNGVNAVHQHVECDLSFFSTTQGYEVEVFDSGTFTLVGDGGYLNWCFGGNYDRNGNSVTFNPIAGQSNQDKPFQDLQLTYQTTAPTQTIAPAPTNPPIPPTNPTRQNPADTDGNYFVNCQKSDGTVSSGMAYYKNLVPGQNVGQQPDDYIDVTHGSYVTWESTGVGTFSLTFPSFLVPPPPHSTICRTLSLPHINIASTFVID